MLKKKKRIILLIALTVVTLLGITIVVCLALSRPGRPIDYDDPESLWVLAERTEQYIIRANPDKDSPARKEAPAPHFKAPRGNVQCCQKIVHDENPGLAAGR